MKSILKRGHLPEIPDIRKLAPITRAANIGRDVTKVHAVTAVIAHTCTGCPFSVASSNKLSSLPGAFHQDYIISISYRTNSTIDLGVLFGPQLSFPRHMRNIVSSSLEAFGFVIRNSSEFANSYFAFVRSKLEYAHLFGNPITLYTSL